MANTLGTISVDLTANVASFVTGLATASSHAKKTGAEITESFSRIGELAGSALAPFGEIGRVIGETLGQIGALGGSAAQSISKMTGGMSLLAVGGGVAVGAIAAVEVAAIGLAIHTAEAAARILVMSQTTGVSVEALSGLAFVAKQSGVEADVMEKGLTKLNKSIFAAGTAAPGAVNAFTRLHIAVRDSSGAFRDTQDVFRDVAEKFSNMADGPVKGALAIQLFGKAGAGLIPILNQGKQGIDDFLETARALGIVLDTETAEAAHKFEQSLNTISAVGQGLQIHLMRELLPAIQTVVDALVKGMKDKDSDFMKVVDAVVWVTKATIALGETFFTIFAQIGRGIGAAITQFGELASFVMEATNDIYGTGNPTDVVGAFKDTRNRMKAIDDLFQADSKKAWKDNSDFIENIMGPKPPTDTRDRSKKTKTDVDTKPEKEDSTLERIKERIAALGREASEWLKIGQAGSQAEQLIAEAVKKGSDEFGKLRDLAAKEKDPVRRSNALSLVSANEQFIEGAEAAGVYAAAIKGIVAELDKQHLKAQEEISATEALTSAYKNGDVAAALVTAHFADQTAKVSVLKQAHDLLAAKLGEENDEVKQLAEGYALASRELTSNAAAYATEVHAKLNLEIEKSTAAFGDELPALRAISAAYFDTAAAARAAQVELKVSQFRTANPSAGEDDIARVRALESQKSNQAFDNTVSEQASKLDLIQSYKLEINQLDILREKLQEYGRSTLLVDAAIYDANDRMIQQWDTAISKVGTFSERFRGLMNELALEGKNFSGKIFDSFHKAIDDLESQLAKFVVTGKANFKEILQSMEESIVKAGIQKVVGTVGGFINQKVFGGAIPGLGGKADGSQSNPFYVVSVGGKGGGLGGIFGGKGSGGDGEGDGGGGLFGTLSSMFSKGPEGVKEGKGFGDLFGGGGNGDFGGEASGGDSGGGGIGSMFSGIFSKMSSVFSSVIGSITSVISKIGSSIGSAVGGIGSFFGGFLADGGDVTPGKAYVVGEKHPEFFVPNVHGHVTPSLEMGGSTSHHYSTINLHLHGVSDYDSFRKSKSQLYSEMQHQASVAYQRNR
jgi:hypothetical protein